MHYVAQPANNVISFIYVSYNMVLPRNLVEAQKL